jgi:hypothetical protein
MSTVQKLKQPISPLFHHSAISEYFSFGRLKFTKYNIYRLSNKGLHEKAGGGGHTA